MIYLISAVFLSSLFSVIFKICQQKKIDNNIVLFVNYVTALLFSAVPIIITILSGSNIAGQDCAGVGLADFSLPPVSWCFAAIQGMFFLTGFIVMDRSVWRSGVALTTVAARASLVLSLILSWAILGQSAPRWFPVAIMFAAILFIILPTETIHHAEVRTNKTDEQRSRLAVLLLFLLFLLYAFSDFSLKLSQHIVEVRFDGAARERHLESLTMAIFSFATVYAFINCLLNRSFNHFGVKPLIGGLALGLVNCACTSFVLRALDSMSTSLFYPVYNVGIVTVSALTGIIFFKEKLKWLQIVGFVLAAVGITLLFAF